MKNNQLQFTHFIGLLFILFFFNSCNTKTSDAVPNIIISNVTIIDAINGTRSGMSVGITDNKITSIDKNLKAYKASTEIDGTGKFLIPGLWDAHIHMAFDPEITDIMFDLFLMNGVTSVRDIGGQIHLVKPWKDKSIADPKNTPRLMMAGPLLDGTPRVYDGSSPSRPELGIEAVGVDGAVAIVDSFAAIGVDLIKAYEMLTPEQFVAVVDRAKSYGLPVTGHVPLSMDVMSASNAGLRSMEHLRNLEMSCVADWEEMRDERRMMLAKGQNEAGGDLRSRMHQAHRYVAVGKQDDIQRKKVIETLAKNETWQIPTLTISTATQNRVYARDQWRKDFQYLPDTATHRWTTNAISASEIPVSENNENYANWAVDMVKRLSDGGVGIMAGTDTPIFFLTPGFSLHEELRLLVKAGLTPIQVLEAATLRPAQYFNMENNLGSVDVGKIADLLLLDGNPLEDISNTEKINAVVKDGNVFDQVKLKAIKHKLLDN